MPAFPVGAARVWMASSAHLLFPQAIVVIARDRFMNACDNSKRVRVVQPWQPAPVVAPRITNRTTTGAVYHGGRPAGSEQVENQ